MGVFKNSMMFFFPGFDFLDIVEVENKRLPCLLCYEISLNIPGLKKPGEKILNPKFQPVVAVGSN
jgi:hypothetical protein